MVSRGDLPPGGGVGKLFAILFLRFFEFVLVVLFVDRLLICSVSWVPRKFTLRRGVMSRFNTKNTKTPCNPALGRPSRDGRQGWLQAFAAAALLPLCLLVYVSSYSLDPYLRIDCYSRLRPLTG